MHRTMLFKKFLMPCGLCAAVPAMKPAKSAEDCLRPCKNEGQPKKLIKPSELPIYSVEDGYSEQMSCVDNPSIVEENIRKARKSVQGLKVVYDELYQNVSSGVENLKFVVDYLQDKNNLMPRVGAVGIGGLSGLVLGLRGGIFKRILYTTTGAGIVQAICFPKETSEGLHIAGHYATIGYNFVFGVKPGDDKPEILAKENELLQTLLDSEFIKMLTGLFEQITSKTATEKTEEKPSPSKKE